jgi:hypothetical protein
MSHDLERVIETTCTMTKMEVVKTRPRGEHRSQIYAPKFALGNPARDR